MICLQCKQVFHRYWCNPETGYRHNLSSRKFCLECSPFGSHNTRALIQTSDSGVDPDRPCTKCGFSEPDATFSHTSKRVDGTRRRNSWCNKCLSQNSVERGRQMKQQAVGYLGGKCIHCGYSKCISAMDFHHREPDKKDFSISTTGKSFEKLKPELDKCDLVCANCHREIHS